MNAVTAPRVAILVPTFRRPTSLEALLLYIDAAIHRASDESGNRWRFRVFIADNDAERQQGIEVARGLAGQLDFELELLVEAAQGVSRVRNRLLSAALAWQARYLLLIDDDEWPTQEWISCMLDCAESNRADIVSAPVRPDYEAEPPRWIVVNALFNDAYQPTGEFPRVQRTGNTLLRSEILTDAEQFPEAEWFSVTLGRYGGEDSHLIERLVAAGARHVWCEEAVVYERIPAPRLTYAYLAARAYRSGNCGMLYRSLLLPGLQWQCMRVGKSAFLLLRWCALGYRCLWSDTRKRHLLDWHVLRGRIAAHAGRYRSSY